MTDAPPQTTGSPISGVPRVRRVPHPTPAAIAGALSYAFLAADQWATNSLIDAGARVLGARRRWLRTVVADVVAVYHRPPADSSRELASFVVQLPAFVEAIAKAKQQRRPIGLHHFPAAPSQARDRGDPVPVVDTVGELATLLGVTVGHLEWCADTKNWNRRAPAGRLQHYRYEWRQRPGRTPRLLEVPEERIRRVQRTLLDTVIGLIPTNVAAHGFVASRSAATGAALHTAREIVVTLDLTTFFTRVTAARIYGVFRQSGFPESVAHILTGLCTNSVPPRVIAAMPPGGSADERFALRQALAGNHLPQGAPSSPMLANLAIRRLDSRLTGWANAIGATYTRYADDLAFSGDRDLARRPDAFIRGVHRIVLDEGHNVNPRKTRVRRSGTKQTVTGIVVNERTNISRHDYDALKALLHNCAQHGPDSQNLSHHVDLRAHLMGRIAWVTALNPHKGEVLHTKFALIRW
ncbi:RNA-directed DNA polymerase [Salinibacterium sp. UTAS2018]|uniref:reverse transcriptase family protein n=1 Tax=Salinibacterium sp. UTAS2018 TaxID=2508880 RepID=UPI001009706A|nr:reverse transcriptase family protein [Salinibacterium sp. UTAS2018]QAV70526.1 RNA-directed DNA polymerase [Salinibacterium sp. UTAS2018]